MTIRSWYFNGLRAIRWDEMGDKQLPPIDSSLMVPGDFNVFIIVTGSQTFFEDWCTKERLKIHWKQPQPAYNYNYPDLPARLLTYIVVKEQ